MENIFVLKHSFWRERVLSFHFKNTDESFSSRNLVSLRFYYINNSPKSKAFLQFLSVNLQYYWKLIIFFLQHYPIGATMLTADLFVMMYFQNKYVQGFSGLFLALCLITLLFFTEADHFLILEKPFCRRFWGLGKHKTSDRFWFCRIHGESVRLKYAAWFWV